MDAWDDARKSLNCIEHSKAAIVHGVKILKKCRGGLNGYVASVTLDTALKLEYLPLNLIALNVNN